MTSISLSILTLRTKRVLVLALLVFCSYTLTTTFSFALSTQDCSKEPTLTTSDGQSYSNFEDLQAKYIMEEMGGDKNSIIKQYILNGRPSANPTSSADAAKKQTSLKKAYSTANKACENVNKALLAIIVINIINYLFLPITALLFCYDVVMLIFAYTNGRSGDKLRQIFINIMIKFAIVTLCVVLLNNLEKVKSGVFDNSSSLWDYRP